MCYVDSVSSPHHVLVSLLMREMEIAYYALKELISLDNNNKLGKVKVMHLLP